MSELLLSEISELKEQLRIEKTRYSKLMDLIRRVRGHQIEYFRYRSRDILDKSKHLEKVLDAILKEEVKKKESGQKGLFGQ